MDRLTLSEALASNRLADFVNQAERDGVGSADQPLFDKLVERVTAPQPSDQTSRSPARGGLRGK